MPFQFCNLCCKVDENDRVIDVNSKNHSILFYYSKLFSKENPSLFEILPDNGSKDSDKVLSELMMHNVWIDFITKYDSFIILESNNEIKDVCGFGIYYQFNDDSTDENLISIPEYKIELFHISVVNNSKIIEYDDTTNCSNIITYRSWIINDDFSQNRKLSFFKLRFKDIIILLPIKDEHNSSLVLEKDSEIELEIKENLKKIVDLSLPKLIAYIYSEKNVFVRGERLGKSNLQSIIDRMVSDGEGFYGWYHKKDCRNPDWSPIVKQRKGCNDNKSKGAINKGLY